MALVCDGRFATVQMPCVVMATGDAVHSSSTALARYASWRWSLADVSRRTRGGGGGDDGDGGELKLLSTELSAEFGAGTPFNLALPALKPHALRSSGNAALLRARRRQMQSFLSRVTETSG